MTRIAIPLLLCFFIPSPLAAALPFPLEGLLERAKVVFIGEVSKFEEGKVTLKVGTRLYGDPHAAGLTFTFVDRLNIEPVKGERCFVLSQGHDRWGEPKDVILLGQANKGQASYCGWIMLPIQKKDGAEIVTHTFSFRLRKSENAFKTPLQLDEAIRLVNEQMEAVKKEARWQPLRQIGWDRTPANLEALMKIADGADKEVARQAVSRLSDFSPTPELIALLNRKSHDPDAGLALKAAIVTCYSGDWSGFDILLGHVSCPDPKLRQEAVAQLVDSRFRRHAERVVPLLLERLRVETDPKIIERTIESLQNYPSPDVLKAIRQFQNHKSELVRRRVDLVEQTITRELGRKKD